MLCELFNVASSCYYEFKQRKPDANRIRLASRIKELFNMSRGAAGSRALVSMLRSENDDEPPAQGNRTSIFVIQNICSS